MPWGQNRGQNPFTYSPRMAESLKFLSTSKEAKDGFEPSGPRRGKLDREIRWNRVNVLSLCEMQSSQENAAALKKHGQVSAQWAIFQDEKKIVRKPFAGAPL